MSRTLPCLLSAGALLILLPGATQAKGPLAEPDDGPDPRGLTIGGSGVAYVTPPDRLTEASIRSALLAGRIAAAPAALAETRTDAADLAAAAGLTLNGLFSIAEIRRPYDDPAAGSFGPGRYCGTVNRAIRRRDATTGRRVLVRRISERRCYFSTSATVALRVTYLPA